MSLSIVITVCLCGELGDWRIVDSCATKHGRVVGEICDHLIMQLHVYLHALFSPSVENGRLQSFLAVVIDELLQVTSRRLTFSVERSLTLLLLEIRCCSHNRFVD